MTVTILPDTFHICRFDPATLTRLAEHVLEVTGVDRDLRIEVDEMNPLTWVVVEAIDPVVVLKAASGAFEDPRKPRDLSETTANDSLAKALFRIHDRLDPTFGDPPAEGEVPLPEQAVWDTWAVGRAVRHGLAGQEARYRYIFRNRHGFTDAADAAFDHLWTTTDTLRWADVQRIAAELAAPVP